MKIILVAALACTLVGTCYGWGFMLPGEAAGGQARFCPHEYGNWTVNNCDTDADCNGMQKCCTSCYGALACMKSCKNYDCLYTTSCTYGFKVNEVGCAYRDCRCRVPTETEECDLGYGVHSFPMYCYDHATQYCTTFDYKGCGGNSGMFDTMEECLLFYGL